ncbi:MAG: aminotransferase class I/II-fold pyridoxal phosphate-dependent enzyme [Pseudomonadota bacterium]
MPDDHQPLSTTRESRSLRPAHPAVGAAPLVTPLWQSVVYREQDADALDASYDAGSEGFTYSREGHPNARAVSHVIDAMEGLDPAAGGGTMAGSGMGAIAAALLGVLKAGDHVVASDQLYGRSLRLLTRDLPRFGVTASLVDTTDAAGVTAAVRPETRMIMVEVVSNPTIRIADMEGIARIAKAEGVLLFVDNTFTTPLSYRPFDHGADIVMHSVTKLMAGHSDVLLGWAAARDPEINLAIREAGETWGTTGAPFDCWLAERGLASFHLRHRAASENAALLADRLAGLPGVEAVFYPGRADHPDHNRASAVLDGRWGNMLSFRLAGGRAEVNAFLRAAAEVPFAPTLGDVATTMSHPASSSHRAVSAEARAAVGITEGFIRLSVGIDDAERVGAALERAIQSVHG